MTAEAPVVIFDLGGVLVQRRPERFIERLMQATGRSESELLPTLRDPRILEDFERGRMTTEQVVDWLNARVHVGWTVPQFLEAWNSILIADPEAERVVRALKGRHRLAVLSNTNPPHDAFVRRTCPVYQLIDDWMVSYEMGVMKPDPEIYRLALRRLGVPALQTVYLDDLPEFVAAGAREGLRAVQHVPGTSLAASLRASGIEVA